MLNHFLTSFFDQESFTNQWEHKEVSKKRRIWLPERKREREREGQKLHFPRKLMIKAKNERWGKGKQWKTLLFLELSSLIVSLFLHVLLCFYNTQPTSFFSLWVPPKTIQIKIKITQPPKVLNFPKDHCFSMLLQTLWRAKMTNELSPNLPSAYKCFNFLGISICILGTKKRTPFFLQESLFPNILYSWNQCS